MRQNTSISFTDQSSHLHTGLVRYPEELVFADSAKCAVEIRLYDSQPQPGDENEPIMLTVKEDGSQSGYSETRVRDRNGWAYFDIARYVQMLLGDLDPLGTFDYSEDAELVAQKNIRLILSSFGETFFEDTFEAVHGNNRIGDRWWSGVRTIRWWPAYPFALDLPNTTIGVVNENGGVGTWDFNIQSSLSFARVRANLGTFVNSLPVRFRIQKTYMFTIAGSSQSHVAGTSMLTDGDNGVNLVADKCPADPNAAYLRWLDRHCELRHWLFSKYRDTDTVKATEERRAGFDPDRIDDGVLQDGRLWDGVLTKELTVNTGYLQGWEYDIVESIINAPFVDMLDMDEYLADGTIIWHRLTVKPGSYTRQLRNAHSTDHNHQLAVTLQYDGERSVGV